MIFSAEIVPRSVNAFLGISSSTFVRSNIRRFLAITAVNFRGLNWAWPGNRTAPAIGNGSGSLALNSALKPIFSKATSSLSIFCLSSIE